MQAPPHLWLHDLPSLASRVSAWDGQSPTDFTSPGRGSHSLGNNSVTRHTRRSGGWSSYLPMKEGTCLHDNSPSSWCQASLICGGLWRFHFSYFGWTFKLLYMNSNERWNVFQQCPSMFPQTWILLNKGIYQEDKCDKQHPDYSLARKLNNGDHANVYKTYTILWNNLCYAFNGHTVLSFY